MTPVTGAVTDREEYGLVPLTGLGQRRVAPGMPIHRVISVLL
jgi:hypothetical protein